MLVSDCQQIAGIDALPINSRIQQNGRTFQQNLARYTHVNHGMGPAAKWGNLLSNTTEGRDLRFTTSPNNWTNCMSWSFSEIRFSLLSSFLVILSLARSSRTVSAAIELRFPTVIRWESQPILQPAVESIRSPTKRFTKQQVVGNCYTYFH